jgi:hypothetical protein
MADTPHHPDYLEDLGVKPDRVRVYYVDDPYLSDDDYPLKWQADAVATVDGQLAVSGACVNFHTWAEAMAYLPDLWRQVSLYAR